MHQLPLTFEVTQESSSEPCVTTSVEKKEKQEQPRKVFTSAVVLPFRSLHAESEQRNQEAAIDRLVESVKLFM